MAPRRNWAPALLAAAFLACSSPGFSLPSAPQLPPRAAPAPAAPLQPPATARPLSFFLAALLAFSFAPLARARDGAISPPTCVSIVNAEVNCPPRARTGGVPNAEAKLKAAQASLAESEKEAGKVLGMGESLKGEPELINFLQAELKRLDMTRSYLEGLRGEMAGQEQQRWLSRLVIAAPDVKQEATFWCECAGMQKYLDLPGGGAVVAYGPPELKAGDEGAFFGIEIWPEGKLPKSRAGAPTIPEAKLSFVQIATPSLIRLSKIVSSGGVLNDGYGYYDIRSPAGVDVRAYVEDRRDPVELVVLAAPDGKGFDEASRALQAVGFEERGEYVKVSPDMQAYMPDLPKGNKLFSNLAGGGPQQKVQVLLLPERAEEAKSILDDVPTGATLYLDENDRYSVDVMEKAEVPKVTLSPVKGAGLSVLAPRGAVPKLPAGVADGFSVSIEGAKLD